ncbi:coth protein-domain-containing protein [Neocallimastix sp. 'constans']|jgi:hypothetical protein
MSFCKIITLLFFVYGVLSVTPFVEQGKRAKIFELIDNNVPTIKVTIPETDFISLKEAATPHSYYYKNGTFDIVQKCQYEINFVLNLLKNNNYKLNYPRYNISEILPELKIDNTGFSNIEVEKLMDNFDFDIGNATDSALALSNIISNNESKFNLIKIWYTLYQLRSSDISNFDFHFELYLRYLSYIKSTEPLEHALLIQAIVNLYIPDFKTKNALMTFELDGDIKIFKKVTFSLSGQNSRNYSKLNYNIKIKGGEDLYGRKQFKIRSDNSEPTFLRTKLIADIHNYIDLPSISANFANFYINDVYMGFYIITDSFKPSWINYIYGDEDTSNLYKCENTKNGLTTYKATYGCKNENDEVTDITEWVEFLNKVDQAESLSDLENVVDIDKFLIEMALEYLLDSWDHIQNGHNFYMYKTPQGLWTYLTYDFDLDFGQNKQPPQSYNDYLAMIKELNSHILNILILTEPTRFEEKIKQLVTEVFNPMILYPHIDELKEFIKPYVIFDKTPDANGKYPGRINNDVTDDFYSLEQWDINCEFTQIENMGCSPYGLKYWILGMYRNVCNHFKMNCDPIYMDENYDYTSNKNPKYNDDNNGELTSSTTDVKISTPSSISTSVTKITISSSIINTTSSATDVKTPAPSSISTSVTKITIPSSIVSTTSSTSTQTVVSAPSSIDQNLYKCLSEIIGYSCCPLGYENIYHDNYGDWGYDFENDTWCGLTPYINDQNEQCWSEPLGYPCCQKCSIIETNESGSWGFELNQWCGIPTYCQQ